jgi:minor extracellular serine protease Vpr
MLPEPGAGLGHLGQNGLFPQQARGTSMAGRHPGRRRAAVVLAAALATAALAPPAGSSTMPSAATDTDTDTDLYLVTLTGPGTSRTSGVLPGGVLSLWMTSAQDQVLASVGAGEPVYRWTTALSGVAVRLTGDQAAQLAADPRVALVEPDRVLQLAGSPTASRTATVGAAGPARGGAGTVIGFVDSGISPEGPVFADGPGLGPAPSGFAGECRTAPDWPASACTSKVVGAQWFVDGFGADRVRDASSMSARDDVGHGTAVASVAAGNSGLVARVRGQQLGTFAGVAPDARIAAYKACWTAPDPDDDGCSAADVVTAVDRATADKVDVLNVSVAGTSTRDPAEDTVQRALLGAAEADIVVVAAAGNGRGAAAYAAPWVTTVGATTGEVRRGLVVRSGASGLRGVTSSGRTVGPARLVVGADVGTAAVSPRESRLCAPGSLDAAQVAGRIVLCERGGVARTDKSLAVRQADGVGMVLANRVAGMLHPDLHAVPTVHVDAAAGRSLLRWLGRRPAGRVTLRSQGVYEVAPRVAGWSRTGDLGSGVVAPDVLAVGSGALAADRPGGNGSRWQLVSGTSVSAAQVSGAAALLRAGHRWSAVAVRSALTGTALPVAGRRTGGAGLVRPGQAFAAPLGVLVADTDYRAWLDGRRTELGTGPLVLGPDRRTATRTVTNLSRRTQTFAARVVGLDRLQVGSQSLTLVPGESGTVTLRIDGQLSSGLAGVVEWRSSHGGPVVRWSVVVAR